MPVEETNVVDAESVEEVVETPAEDVATEVSE
jgi:hypothetical protein